MKHPQFPLRNLLICLAALLLLAASAIGCDPANPPASSESAESTTAGNSIPEDISSADPTETAEPPAESTDTESTADSDTTDSPAGTTQKPAESTTREPETTQKPAETTQKPAETTQKPAETTQRPAVTTQKPAETTQRPAVTTQRPPETTQRPAETTQKPEETTREPETTRPPEIPTEPTPSKHISAHGILQVNMEEIFKISDYTDSNGVHCRVVQGGCTDGTYYYVGLNNGIKTSDSVTAILKYEIATGTLVKVYEDLRVAHCNDMEYNKDTNEILVVHNEPERWFVSIFDADTMERKRVVTLGNGAIEIYSLAYDPYEQCYWVGLSYGFNFAKLDLNFNQIGEIYIGVNTGYVKQGIDCDDKYIYFQQYKNNAIIVYDKTGAFVREIPLPKTSYEAENIFHIGDTFYIGYYKSRAGGMLYKTTLKQLTASDASVTMTEFITVPQRTDANGVFYKIGQGSCSDGTYLYLLMNNDNKAGYFSSLHKIDPRTGETVKIIDGIQSGSSNDITYNPNTKELIIATDNPDKNKIVIIDAETLTVKETKTLDLSLYCIAYDSARNGYWVGICKTYNFAFLDASFRQVGATVTGYNSGLTKQAMEYDGEYLYFLQSAQNAIVICEPDGTIIGLPYLKGFPEGATAQNICRIGDTYYIGFYQKDVGCVIYKAEIEIVKS